MADEPTWTGGQHTNWSWAGPPFLKWRTGQQSICMLLGACPTTYAKSRQWSQPKSTTGLSRSLQWSISTDCYVWQMHSTLLALADSPSLPSTKLHLNFLSEYTPLRYRCKVTPSISCQRQTQYILVQWNWFSDVSGCMNSGASNDVREPISLHQAVHKPKNTALANPKKKPGATSENAIRHLWFLFSNVQTAFTYARIFVSLPEVALLAALTLFFGYHVVQSLGHKLNQVRGEVVRPLL